MTVEAMILQLQRALYMEAYLGPHPQSLIFFITFALNKSLGVILRCEGSCSR